MLPDYFITHWTSLQWTNCHTGLFQHKLSSSNCITAAVQITTAYWRSVYDAGSGLTHSAPTRLKFQYNDLLRQLCITHISVYNRTRHKSHKIRSSLQHNIPSILHNIFIQKTGFKIVFPSALCKGDSKMSLITSWHTPVIDQICYHK